MAGDNRDYSFLDHLGDLRIDRRGRLYRRLHEYSKSQWV
jgi:hypothetical protein